MASEDKNIKKIPAKRKLIKNQIKFEEEEVKSRKQKENEQLMNEDNLKELREQQRWVKVKEVFIIFNNICFPRQSA